MTSKHSSKVVLNMEMPSRCGKCKLSMKTTSGNGFCIITRKSVDADNKSSCCPLSPLPVKKSKTIKLLPCSECGGQLRTKHSSEISGKLQYWYSCKRCGFGKDSPQYGDSPNAAKKAWNNLVS